VQWVDPPAIHPYQEYINYLGDVVIFNLRQELVSALASPDPTSTNDDDELMTGHWLRGRVLLLSVPRKEGQHSTSNSTPATI
jgi:hypothetical protein